MPKKISIVVPCYNESKNIPELHSRIQHIFKNIDYAYELIFIDNASTDDSVLKYKQIVESDKNVRALLMSRNFGTSQPSFFAGINDATGDAVVLIESDLQDPPELILEFIKKWEDGFDAVYGVRIKRKGSLLRRICYKLFYRIFKWLSYIDIPLDAGDFSLIDRKVIDIIKILPEKDIYVRGLRSWAGFKQTGINYTRNDRKYGTTSINFFKNFFWAKKAIVNFSYKPLEFISRIAIFTTFLMLCASAFYFYVHLTTDTPKGFSTILMFMFIFGSIQLLSLGIIGEYLIRMFQEIKGRPPYIISQRITQPVCAQTSLIPSPLEGRDDFFQKSLRASGQENNADHPEEQNLFCVSKDQGEREEKKTSLHSQIQSVSFLDPARPECFAQQNVSKDSRGIKKQLEKQYD